MSTAVIAVQILLFLTIYYQTNRKKITFRWLIGLAVIFLVVIIVLGNYSLIMLFPAFFLYTLSTQKSRKVDVAFFYSIYATFTIILLPNFLGLLFYQFSPNTFYQKYIHYFVFIGILLPILFHYIIIRSFKLDFSILEKEDTFIKNKIIKPLNYWLSVCVVILICIHFYEIFFFKETPIAEYNKYVLFIFTFMFFNIITYISNKLSIYMQLESQRLKENQLQQLNLYTKEIETMYQTVRGFRHDYANILVSLKESIDSGEIKQIEQVYHDVLISANMKLIHQANNIDELANIKNSAVKSVLFWKVTEAREKNINVAIEIKDVITDFKIDLLDFIRIISILMDNAIESAFECKNSNIDIAFFRDKQTIVFIIQNSKLATKLPLNKLFESGFSTKDTHRGTGLFNVKMLMTTYSYVDLDTEISDRTFTQTMTIRM